MVGGWGAGLNKKSPHPLTPKRKEVGLTSAPPDSFPDVWGLQCQDENRNPGGGTHRTGTGPAVG